MRMSFKYCVLLLMIFTLFSCEEVLLGPQPKFITNQEFTPALNVFGILRPDSLYGQPASFFNVSLIVPTVNDTNSNWLLFDADLLIIDIPESDTFKFTADMDSIGQKQYINYNFTPKENYTYQLVCCRTGYDTVFGITTIPEKATVLESGYVNSKVTLLLRNGPGIFMFDIYTYSGNLVLFDRILPDPGNTETQVEVNISSKPEYIDIYTYDMNLANYYGSTNVFVKPNTYRELFSSVENGYGCFGSMNKYRLVFE